MAYYTYDRGELIATTVTVEAAVAVAVATGAGSSVSDDKHLLFVLFKDEPEELSRESLEKWTRRAYAALDRHYPKPPPDHLHPAPADVISLRRRRPVWPDTEE